MQPCDPREQQGAFPGRSRSRKRSSGMKQTAPRTSGAAQVRKRPRRVSCAPSQGAPHALLDSPRKTRPDHRVRNNCHRSGKLAALVPRGADTAGTRAVARGVRRGEQRGHSPVSGWRPAGQQLLALERHGVGSAERAHSPAPLRLLRRVRRCTPARRSLRRCWPRWLSERSLGVGWRHVAAANGAELPAGAHPRRLRLRPCTQCLRVVRRQPPDHWRSGDEHLGVEWHDMDADGHSGPTVASPVPGDDLRSVDAARAAVRRY